MIRTNQWKLIEYPLANKTQLFHLQNDPFEQHDLASASEHSDRTKQLSGLLRQWLESQRVQQTP